MLATSAQTSRFLLKLSALVLLALLPGLTSSTKAVDVFTDPVGFITLNIAGGSPSQVSYLGLGMVRVQKVQSIITAHSGTVLTDSSQTWTNNQFNGTGNAHFVELLNGNGAGRVADIVATGPNSITTSIDFGTDVVPGTTTYRIRPDWTLATVFGATNDVGFGTGLSATTADNVLVFDPVTKAYTTYYFRTGAGWRLSTDPFTDKSNAVLDFEGGVITIRRNAVSLSSKLVGAVKLGKTSIPIATGANIVGNVYPITNLTLNASNLFTTNSATGFQDGLSATSADDLLVWTGTTYLTYYFRTGAGWRTSTDPFTDRGTVAIPMAQSVVIQRNGSRSNFLWMVPQVFTP
jgi:uncharacterized protein (TIGR02597 family)